MSTGLWLNGRVPVLQTGDAGSIPAGSKCRRSSRVERLHGKREEWARLPSVAWYFGRVVKWTSHRSTEPGLGVRVPPRLLWMMGVLAPVA